MRSAEITTSRVQIFAEQIFRKIYFPDFDPKWQNSIPRKLLKLALSKKFVPRNSFFLISGFLCVAKIEKLYKKDLKKEDKIMVLSHISRPMLL